MDISLSWNAVPGTTYKPLLMDGGEKHAVGSITSNNGTFGGDRMLKKSKSEEWLKSWNQPQRWYFWEK